MIIFLILSLIFIVLLLLAFLLNKARTLNIPFLKFLGLLHNKDGELLVKLELSRLSDEYIDASDVTLPVGLNDTTQIDHIVFSPYGIFVIETKTLSGNIFGNVNDKQWSQQFPNGKTFTFQNPFRQNYKHIKVVENLLSKEGVSIPVHSIVVLAGKANFGSPSINELCYLLELNPLILSFNKNIIPKRDLLSAIRAVMRVSMKPGEETDRIHVSNLKARFNNFNQKKG